MFEWLRFNRPDITWLKGPLADGSYLWDTNLPNQQEIADLINSFDPQWIPPSKVPTAVTPRQIRLALITSGISLTMIENVIDSLPEPNKSLVRVTWEYSVEFQRENAVMKSMAPLLGLTETQIDQLFILASTL